MDFSKLTQDTPDVDPKDPIALYGTLDRQHTHVEPRDAQVKVLRKWQERRGERDIVLKLATGAGKTTTGLIMLLSHMRETSKPTLYLCPTNQLVQQVCDESKRCGVPTIAFGGGSNAIPADAQAGEAVLVTSVQNLFNAKSIFARASTSFEPHAIVIDDAHAALEIIRAQFRIKDDSSSQLYLKLYALFKSTLQEQSPGNAASIDTGDPTATAEVPYWTWRDQISSVAVILAELVAADEKSYSESMAEASKVASSKKKSRSTTQVKQPPAKGGSRLPLVWGLVRDCLLGMRCVFSGSSVEIVPEVLPVGSVRLYDRAPHRLFMSATISDEAALVRELDCSASAAEDPIELPDAGGLGERMILVPRLMTGGATPLAWEDLSRISASVAKKHAVVVVAPSTAAAQRWATAGAHVVSDTYGVGPAVDDLRSGKKRFVAFANRYDGIDLPDDACRLLILDGAPIASSLLDAIDGPRAGAANVRQRTVIHRIEQGLGRAVRSPSDYAAVILWGDELVSIISNKLLCQGMTEETRLQIELGLSIAKASKVDGDWGKSVAELVQQCLARDVGWKKYYTQKVKVAVKPVDRDVRRSRIQYATAERNAWNLFISNRGDEAAHCLQDYINRTRPSDETRAWLLQRCAWYVRGTDVNKSLEFQKSAHESDRLLLRPPQGVQYKRQALKITSAAAQVLNWYKGFEHGNAMIAVVEHLRSQLVFDPNASSENFEEGMRCIGDILGLDSSRPEREYGIGPDVLWLSGQTVVPLEAKNRLKDDTLFISKNDAGQLTQSSAWAKATYAERTRLVPIIAHRTAHQGPNAFLPEGSRVFTPRMLGTLLSALGGFVAALSKSPAERWEVDQVDRLLQDHKFSMEQFLATYTVKAE